MGSGKRCPLGGTHRVLAPFHLLDKSHSLQGLAYSSYKVKNIIPSYPKGPDSHLRSIYEVYVWKRVASCEGSGSQPWLSLGNFWTIQIPGSLSYSLGFRPAILENGMATHFSILAWRIPWTEEPGRLQSIGSQRVGHNWATNTYLLTKAYVCVPSHFSVLSAHMYMYTYTCIHALLSWRAMLQRSHGKVWVDRRSSAGVSGGHNCRIHTQHMSKNKHRYAWVGENSGHGMLAMWGV